MKTSTVLIVLFFCLILISIQNPRESRQEIGNNWNFTQQLEEYNHLEDSRNGNPDELVQEETIELISFVQNSGNKAVKNPQVLEKKEPFPQQRESFHKSENTLQRNFIPGSIQKDFFGNPSGITQKDHRITSGPDKDRLLSPMNGGLKVLSQRGAGNSSVAYRERNRKKSFEEQNNMGRNPYNLNRILTIIKEDETFLKQVREIYTDKEIQEGFGFTILNDQQRYANIALIIQVGKRNQSLQTQDGTMNQAYSIQGGIKNKDDQFQKGRWNTAVGIQIGLGNFFLHDQTLFENDVFSLQVGVGNNNLVKQIAFNNISQNAQWGTFNSALVFQTGRQHWSQITQVGNFNTSLVIQTGGPIMLRN